MKIKHWQGYGSVNMKVLKNTPNLVIIDVYGEHEWGLDRDDKYDVCKWLLNKVNGHKETDYTQISNLQLNDRYEKDQNTGLTIERCTYTISIR